MAVELKFSEYAQKEVEKILVQYSNTKGSLIMILHAIQEKFGYLPKEALEIVSDKLKVSLSEIYGIVTFYSFFRLEPQGKHVLRLCMGTACYVKGAADLLTVLEQLGLKEGKVTEDGFFSLDLVRCIGACSMAPAIMIDDEVYGKLTTEKVKKLIENFRKENQ
ncbi:MAG TPA: NADH-quinone oxidoreductase subunit NuoE [Dictyoglomaceae bacterium]|nr:NADH-quinone oxidoreductase subunit NuoE [Dictyoglomaceae bacterium]HOL39523.1 NADH-quinone oxidoreductase subunit NuoE [Dictyoglomaceae bacterium]HPP16098.1 NADH-quinone oxidoreductase subunit NuoE [Dictyoglomaceae bacterium]